MAVCRGGIAFWVGRVRSQGSFPPIKQHCWSQAVDWQGNGRIRYLSSSSWALVPPNSLRYLNTKQPALSHPFHHASQPQRASSLEEEWEASVSVCVLVRPGEGDCQRTLVEVPLFGQARIGELLALGGDRPAELLFPLTTVDGCREDDISVGAKEDGLGRNCGEPKRREQGSFRSLFEAEGCPAPFMYGSSFYCFHCPEPLAGGPPGHVVGLGLEPLDLSLLLPAALCSHEERVASGCSERDSEDQERLALVYEKLRTDLPGFFFRGHDYTMYAGDVEFINGLLNTKTRGRVLYQVTLSMWRLLCLCYYAEARLEILKLTRHAEDGTVKARWRIKGLPFHSVLLRFYRKDKTHLYRSFDAFSTFYVGRDGLIHRHKVEKVMQVQPPVLPRVTSLLAGMLVALGVQDHRPALNLLPLLLSSFRQGRN
ncbi:uncharacterized protein C6orf136 homolog [Aplochiton taeniatus]